jgi:hypothetical protein
VQRHQLDSIKSPQQRIEAYQHAEILDLRKLILAQIELGEA